MSASGARCYFRGQRFIYENIHHLCGDCDDHVSISHVSPSAPNDQRNAEVSAIDKVVFSQNRQNACGTDKSAENVGKNVSFVSTASWSPIVDCSATSSRSSSSVHTTNSTGKLDMLAYERWKAHNSSRRKSRLTFVVS